MKILIVNQHKEDVLGGSEIQCDLIAKYLTKFGHTVIYGAINGKSESYNTKYTVNKISRSSKSIIQLCKKVQPDVVYWRFNKHLFYKTVKAIKQQKIPIVFGISHINDVTRFAYKPSTTKNIISTLLKKYRQQLISAYNYRGINHLQGIIAQNNSQYNLIQSNNKIQIYSSVIGKLVNFNWKKPYCVWVANIKKSKNPEEFIRLARKFENKEIDFIMVGKIQQNNYEFIEKGIDLPKNFIYLGPKTYEEVNGILKNSLFMIHTCNPEGFPNNFMQAWKQAKPTISLYFDPNGFITSERIGFYSKSREQMQLDVEKLIDDEELRNEMGHQAYRFAHENFDPNQNINKLERFLKEIVNGFNK